MLELLQHAQVPDFINVVVVDIQYTKRFLYNKYRLMKKGEAGEYNDRILQINIKKNIYLQHFLLSLAVINLN